MTDSSWIIIICLLVSITIFFLFYFVSKYLLKSIKKIPQEVIKSTSCRFSFQNNQIFPLEDSLEINGVNQIFKCKMNNMKSPDYQNIETEYIKVISKKNDLDDENCCNLDDQVPPELKRNTI